jgi:4-hydroxybenzoate polyprenyltransferase
MFKAALGFARLRIVATCYALVFLGAASAGEINLKVVLTLILIILVTIHANSINDYADREIDKINLKNATDRPLVNNDVSLKKFWVIHFFSGIFALLISVFYGPATVLLAFGLVIVDYIYSLKPFKLSYRPIASPVLLSAAYVYYSFSLGFFAVAATKPYPWMLSAGLLIGFAARLLLKDFRDAEGDKRYGKETFLLHYGIKTTCITSGILWVIAMFAAAWSVSFAVGVIAPLIVGVGGVIHMLSKLSQSNKINRQQNIISQIAKAANFSIVTLLTYLLCKDQPNLFDYELILIPALIGSSLLVFNWFELLAKS